MQIQNSLWVEKYRPKSLSDYVGNEDVIKKIKKWLDQGDVPHLLFSGKAGTGKTTLGKIIALHLDCELLYINASDENSVDVVREKIKGFASTSSMSKWKLILLDESDYITANGQAALRQIMEAFSRHCRFILTCNYVERIIDPIQSRCIHFDIHPPSKKEVATRCVNILRSENVKFEPESIVAIVNDSYPDIRRIINSLQRNCMDGNLIIDASYRIAANYMDTVIEELSSKGDPKTKYQSIRKIIADSKVRVFDDFYRYLFDNIEKFAPDGKRAMVLLHIADSQYRSALVVDKEIELMALIVNLIKDLYE